jgi:molybdate-binding protein/DNA-binding XRE family transcriptional regulator
MSSRGYVNDRVDSHVRPHRERLALSQQALADVVGVSRQSIVAIEAGRSVPSTALALRLARALRCGVEDLFGLRTESGLAVRLAPGGEDAAPADDRRSRVALAEIDGKWVAHRLAWDARVAADGIIARRPSTRTAVVKPLADSDRLRSNVLVAGCAPLLGALAQHAGLAPVGLRACWLHASSGHALDLLEAKLVHVAGLHLRDASGDANVAAVRARFPGRRLLIANLTRWREGLVVPAGNPLKIRSGADLLRPGLRIARRDEGSGAHKLLVDLLAAEGVETPVLTGPFATGHTDVATLVACGAADVGIAIEGVALASDLGFVPLVEERFDLVVPGDIADQPIVARLLETLENPNFRADADNLPGYDTELCGHVTTLEAA